MSFSKTRLLDVLIIRSCGEGESNSKAVVSWSWYPSVMEWSFSSRQYWQLTVDTVKSGISRGLVLLLSIVPLKGDCGNRILIVLVCRQLSATSTVSILLLSLSKIIVLDLVEGVSLKTWLVQLSFSVTMLVILPCSPVNWRLEDNQLVKSWRSWEIGITLAAISRNWAYCTDKHHCCFIGVGYWCNRTRESSKILRSRSKYDAWRNCNLYISSCWSISWTSVYFQECCPLWGIKLLCYYYFQLTCHIASNTCVSHHCDERVHFLDFITIHSLIIFPLFTHSFHEEISPIY